jgi:cis-zeatin O-glucosyltransferase
MAGGAQLLRDAHSLDDLPVHTFMLEEFLEFIGKRARDAQMIPSSVGILMNTSRALEGEFINFVAERLATSGNMVFSIGLLNPMLDLSALKQDTAHHECLCWLQKQPTASVLYVSFDSMSSLHSEQIE